MPGMADTTALSAPRSRLSREDLPTLGRPTSARRRGGDAPSSRTATGSPSRAASSRSPMPWPCSAEIANRGPKPSRANSPGPTEGPSTLFTTRITRLPVAPELAGDLLVVGQETSPAVDQEQHDVRLLDGPLDLLDRGAEERVVGPEEQAAGVDQLEGGPLPLHLGVVAVARRARPSVGDGLAAPADPIEERRLPDIGATDESDARERDHLGRGLTAETSKAYTSCYLGGGPSP